MTWEENLLFHSNQGTRIKGSDQVADFTPIAPVHDSVKEFSSGGPCGLEIRANTCSAKGLAPA